MTFKFFTAKEFTPISPMCLVKYQISDFRCQMPLP